MCKLGFLKDLTKKGMLDLPDFYLEIAGKRFYLEISQKMGAPAYVGEWSYCDATTWFLYVKRDEFKRSPTWFYAVVTLSGQMLEATGHKHLDRIFMMHLQSALTNELKIVV